MVNWTNHGASLKLSTFSWASSNAWAGHVVEKNGKFYWYVTVSPKTGGGFAIGVAVGDSPTGPFKDALGKPLITNAMTPNVEIDIDPAVFIDTDGKAYIYWGNAGQNAAPVQMLRLKPNMIETEGSIMTFPVNGFTEASYVHKRNNMYYLTYASGWPESISYATSNSPTGPWTSRGIVNGRVSSETNHQSIIEFKGQWYFIYHNAGLPNGGNYRRSVCIDYLYYNTDGTMKRIVQTTTGVKKVVISSLDENSETAPASFNFGDVDPQALLDYEVYDLLGKKISEGHDSKQAILSCLQEGTSYIVTLRNGTKQHSFKILKQ